MKIDDVEQKELIPGTRVRFVHSDRMTVAHWHFDPSIDLPVHSHPHDQITTVLGLVHIVHATQDVRLVVMELSELAGWCRVDPEVVQRHLVFTHVPVALPTNGVACADEEVENDAY